MFMDACEGHVELYGVWGEGDGFVDILEGLLGVTGPVVIVVLAEEVEGP